MTRGKDRDFSRGPSHSEDDMAIRLVVTITAASGKGSELAQAYRTRCAEVMNEPGCEQFELFQSVVNPDRLTLLERWADQAALDAHAQLNRTRPPLRPDLRMGSGEREDYEYGRTRSWSALSMSSRDLADVQSRIGPGTFRAVMAATYRGGWWWTSIRCGWADGIWPSDSTRERSTLAPEAAIPLRSWRRVTRSRRSRTGPVCPSRFSSVRRRPA
jgi:quinol monooxygenase YgiN